MRGGRKGSRKFQNFGKRKVWLSIQQVGESLLEIVFLKSIMENKTPKPKFLTTFSKILHYPTVIDLTWALKARANFVYSNKYKGTPKPFLSGNYRSFYLQHILNPKPRNPLSMNIILKEGRPAFLFKLILKIRFSDALLATEVIFVSIASRTEIKIYFAYNVFSFLLLFNRIVT